MAKKTTPERKPRPEFVSQDPADPDVALAQAKADGYYATTDLEEVKELGKKGIQPCRRDGAKPYRDVDLFVFPISEEKAKELIYA